MKNEKVLVPVILLLIFSGWGCQKEEIPEATAMSRMEKPTQDIESKNLTPAPFAYDSQGKRDPFVPLKGMDEGPKLAWLSLEGILLNQERPLAIINDQIVSRGDIVQGAEVIDIKEDGVTLRYGKEETFLRLK